MHATRPFVLLALSLPLLGFGPVGAPGVADDGDGWTERAGDCDDDEPKTHPGAPEICDARDNDCDGIADPHPRLEDQDRDGVSICDPEPDCDDQDPNINPLADDVCNGVDDDCDGEVDDRDDRDGDGWTACGADGEPGTEDDDCDDHDPRTHPAAEAELCDGFDNDCDGGVGEEEADLDTDGVLACDGDCDDFDDAVHAGAVEQCNGVNDSCLPAIPSWELDADGDGWAICEGDCDDEAPTVFPGSEDEPDDGVDGDCDGYQAITCYADSDGDGYGDPYGAAIANDDGGCPAGYSPKPEDCDDSDPRVSPDMPELDDDGLDNDCSGKAELSYAPRQRGSALAGLVAEEAPEGIERSDRAQTPACSGAGRSGVGLSWLVCLVALGWRRR